MSIEASKARNAGNTSTAAAPAGTTADLTYRRLFGQASFPQLAAGTVLARTAGQLWQIALILFVLQRYHSPALAGFATFLAIVPGLVVSPIAGALLDRHGRLRLILLDYAIAAASLVLLAALSLVGALSPAPLLVIVALSSLTGPLSASGTRTLFPLAVPRDLWDRANAVDSGSMALATVVGPALAGFFVAWVGGEGAFLITAGVFIASGLALFGSARPETSPARAIRCCARPGGRWSTSCAIRRYAASSSRSGRLTSPAASLPWRFRCWCCASSTGAWAPSARYGPSRVSPV